jgi:malonyl-CoA O-methyltransferase
MDPALIPLTAAGRQLAWLMSLHAEPSTEEIQDHLEPTAAGEVRVDLPEWPTRHSGLAGGLLAFGTIVRELPGVVTDSEDVLLRLELDQGWRKLCGVVSVGQEDSAKIALFGLTDRPAESNREVDRIRLLYDRMAGSYEQLAADQAHYWDHARARLAQITRDGFTILDVGCGPGHLTAGLPLSARVIGCDLSPEMVRIAALARPTGSFVVHDFHQPFPAQWPLADVTVALGCLEFCADLAQVARNLAAATKPEGRLLLTLPRAEPGSPQREITLRPDPFSEITLRLREDAEVGAELSAAGLEVIAHEVGPGWTAPGIGTVEYGYWELKVASVDVEVPQARTC